MKIAIFLSQKLPEIGGGYTFESEILVSLFKICSASRHSFVLFSIAPALPQNIIQIKPDNVQIIYPNINLFKNIISKIYRYRKAIFYKLFLPKSLYRIENWFEKFVRDSLKKIDIDVCWSFTTYCPVLDIPYITTVWDLQHRLQPYFPEVSAKGEWENRERDYGRILRKAAFIITGTERGKAEIERFYQVAPERIKVLPFPTPQFALNSSLESDNNILKCYNIPEQYLFYPAQFWAHKNHIGLLLAVKYLRDNYGMILPVVLVGSDRGNLAYVKKVVKEIDLSQQVYFLGFVSQTNLIALYRHAFALTFMSFFGPDNLPPLEAFALKCPVIASNIPGANEQLGNAALLVDPKDEKQIALAIKSLYEDSNLRQTLIQRGLVRALSWTGKDYIQEMLSLLDEFESIRRCWGRGMK